MKKLKTLIADLLRSAANKIDPPPITTSGGGGSGEEKPK